MRRFIALLILIIAALILRTVVSAAAPPADAEGGDAAAAVTYVYWTEVQNGTIRRGAADGSGSPQTCVSGQNDPRGLVIAADLNRMYWVERGAGRMRRADLNCPAGSIQTIGPALTNPDRIALDLVGGKIYWTENKVGTVTSNRIRRANLDGTNPETILDDSAVEEPVGIAIDRANNRLYWTDYGTNAIRRATLDGGNPQLVLQLAAGTNPLDIGLDVANNRMYWASGALGAIYTATLDGSNTSVWRHLGAPRSLVLDLPGNMIYWGDQGTHEIRRDTLNATNNQLLFNAGDGVDQPLGVALLYGTTPDCYDLTRTHTGNGNNPAAAPTSSTGCSNGQYTAGQLINLTATPAAGWRVAGWSGTNNDSSTSTTNSVNMPAADHTVSVIYEEIPVPCFSLSRTHSGSGNNPVAVPSLSTGCGTGQYKAGELINVTATPAAGWRVAGWSGTNNDGSTATTNTVTMPAAAHTVSVFYEEVPVTCFSLTRTHSGNGNNPTASPGSSSGCVAGQYKAGEFITLTAAPAADNHVIGWSGTNNDGSTSTINTVNMPAIDHTVSVAYEAILITCFSLTRTHSGSGNNPVATPAFSGGCGTGQYKAGEFITLTAAPAAGWRVAGWSGTNNDGSTSTTNSVTMPAAGHTVSVTYILIEDPWDFAFYVPIVLSNQDKPCFESTHEVEDNDSATTANGPLCAPGTFTGLADDERDFFTFDTNAAGRVAIVVTNLHVPGMQLSLYYQSTSNPPLDFDTEPDDGLDVELPNGQFGRYYIRVFTNQPNPSETRPYTMQVQFP